MTANLVIMPSVRRKLTEKHNVTEQEIIQCFSDNDRVLLKDKREDHKTDPPTLWFIGSTDFGRLLKVVFIFKDGEVIIKSAFPPNATEIRIYKINARV
jgi:uncharacterized DUF497 family protein